ncbi:MAG: hypothetical protein HY897_02810 [Deltaproteobacteria bacterium]|nr:hypothetical protein [Deltaproteobacteria bacterium]
MTYGFAYLDGGEDAGGNYLWHHVFQNGGMNKSFAIGGDGSLYVAKEGKPYGIYRFVR